MYICVQIPARCPLCSSLDRANDYAFSPIVAPLSPPRLSRALRTHTNAQSALSPRDVDGTLSALSPLVLSLPPDVGGKRLASSMLRRVHRQEEKRVKRRGELSGREYTYTYTDKTTFLVRVCATQRSWRRWNARRSFLSSQSRSLYIYITTHIKIIHWCIYVYICVYMHIDGLRVNPIRMH